MTKDPELVECISVKSAVAMEVKREKVVLFCALISNARVPLYYIDSHSQFPFY